MLKNKVSLKHRLWFAILLPILGFTTLLYTAIHFEMELLLAIPVILLMTLGVSSLLINYYYQPFASLIESIETGLNCFNDEDFSINIAEYEFSEFQVSVDTYNRLSKILRDERMELHQRELLLDTIIQNTPMAIILTSANGEIIYSNLEAKKLLHQTKNLVGSNFNALVDNLPPDLARATINRQEGLYNHSVHDQKQVYFLVCEEFNLNAQIHHLFLYKNMTQEVNKEEILVWKKVIRLISHELNNSLAPIQSLTRSAKKMIMKSSKDEALIDIFDTVTRRTNHLHKFIQQYAEYSRLPAPTLTEVNMRQFISDLEKIVDLPIKTNFDNDENRFDSAQMEQVIINLVKNAKESGSEEKDIELEVDQRNGELNITVKDRGQGMTESQLSQSILPFFTTKSGGTGLGLALSKEIVNAHKGRLKIFNREQGGLVVTIALPKR